MPNLLDYDFQGAQDEYNGYLERQAEYWIEAELEQYLLDAWEALQPAIEVDDLEDADEIPF